MTAQAIAPRFLDLPSRSNEAWKYTPVDVIRALAHEPAARSQPLRLHADALDELAGDHGGLRLVFVNGYFVDAFSRSVPPLAGVTCQLGSANGPEADFA